jgi:ATP-dependent Zn protease
LDRPLDPWGGAWEAAQDERASDALARLGAAAPQFFADAELVGARSVDLRFYADHRLLELEIERGSVPERAFALHGTERTRWLNGDSAPIHETNADEALGLTDDTVEDYLRFFLYFVRGESGPFVLVESPDQIAAADASALRITPLTMRERDADDRWVLEGSIAFDGGLFLATLAVAPDGLVEMVDDQPIGSLENVSVPEYAALDLLTGASPDEPVALPGDREVTEAIVSVLLEDALREELSSESNVLLRHFNSETGSGGPIERLTELMSSSKPVIIVESDLPFVEDIVAGLIDGSQALTGGEVSRASVNPGDELRCVVSHENTMVKLHLVSLHAYRGVYDVERTAHELALGDAAVLIGCERRSDVPEPLRRIADLELTFPRIDRKRFARIFERVFRVKPSPGWDAPGADWTRYLVPADFHMPRRLGFDAAQALEVLKGRVEQRLEQVTPEIGPRLSELHGLGEARQICEDIVADIHAAQAGRIDWSAVDKGLLLVGAPGTGKTTLARALAKECGIKFVVASAAGWQSAGYLDSHLRAMRSDFTEARRYAPAILFIDEIDGIGSREQLSGENAGYHTQVINALLEQIQGINTVDPVIVIGATNYPEKVDPALRRSGRLDQVVELPLPNVASLEQIFGYYLEPYRADNQVGKGVKTRALAELSFGLTGADVERFVRGAARRARRANRKIRQDDLIAEVTGRPRRPDSAPRLGKEEMRRVAVHEAGHTLARLTSSTGGDDLAFVTIVPRMDGSLGFVAAVPSEASVLSRRQMLEELETVLGGRAAEEIVFGADEISTGAGGPSRSSDLAVATRMAEQIVCRSGLGDNGALMWTEQPTPAQQKEIGELLGRAYESVVDRLETNRELLDEVVDVLVEKQELGGADLRELLVASINSSKSLALQPLG